MLGDVLPLYEVYDLPGALLVNVKTRRRHVNTVLLCEAAGFEERNFSFGVEVALVADQNDDYVGTGERPRVRQPVCQRIEGLAAVSHVTFRRTFSHSVQRILYDVYDLSLSCCHASH